MSVLMLFVDGMGIGVDDPSENPLAAGYAPLLSSLLRDGSPRDQNDPLTAMVRLDATLGVVGLPQSGTGQTTLFTGANAARLLGRHFGPYPHSLLHPLLSERNIFRKLREAGRSTCFANAFPQRFFDYLRLHPRRLSVTTLACTMSGVPLLGSTDLMSGNAVSADITGRGWHDLGHPDIVPIPAGDAGARLADLARRYDFVLFEYWKTDHAGHAMDFAEARSVLTDFDQMLSGLIPRLDESTVLLITSDHGNIENLATKAHTLNEVPLVIHGRNHGEMLRRVEDLETHDLCCVTPAILSYLR
jgi:hypothetical protein